MTDAELKDLVASLVVAQKETDRQLKETDRRVNETNRQVGGLANKFGSFTEGLALPSMQQILRDQFRMEVVSPSVRVKKGGEELEIDVLSYANSSLNEVYVVEVKSHLREEGIDQLCNIMERFRYFFPEHKDKKVFGILAAVEMSGRLREQVLAKGFYAAKISDEVFSLDIPAQFTPKSF
ncbi:MAG: DUF3782 domain-containing protein [Gammaproteobacteria bacterium]|nr:DUF3782 domain-containing protein [Gammaproteobacteria bacterium]MBT4330650.1 DUF3782 domain-containing protein [Gammaproteobacteria bacterium]MBT5636315.1 DUF3782 domain-containing protein [Gammaproteobacteria bacterium]